MEPTIYKPSIYKGAGIYKTGSGGGGGDTNPDGSIKKIALLNKDVSHYMEINGLSLSRLLTYEFEYIQSGSGGLFGAIYEGTQAYYYRTVAGCKGYGGAVLGGGTYNSGEYTVSGSTTGAKCKYVSKQNNNNYTFEIYVNDILAGSNTTSFAYGTPTVQKLYLFKCWDRSNNESGTFPFLGLKIKDPDDDSVKYNFTPAEKAGVAGVYEEITNTFYGEPYHDNSIVCL